MVRPITCHNERRELVVLYLMGSSDMRIYKVIVSTCFDDFLSKAVYLSVFYRQSPSETFCTPGLYVY